MMIRAEVVLAGSGDLLPRGGVRVEGERIVQVYSAAEWPAEPDGLVVELPGQVLSPGLINAHCHLDYTGMKGLLPARGFSKWIQGINALKRNFGPEDYCYAINSGFKLLMDAGVTTVLNIEAFPELMPSLQRPPIRTWWFLELIDVRTRHHDDDSIRGLLHFFEDRADWLGGFGLSPHAPYTASIDLYRLARRCSESLDMPMTTHISESLEEHEMFLYGTGPLYEFMSRLGRDCSDCGQGSALSHLYEHRVLGPSCLAVHLNYLQEYDWPALVESRMSVVHCPKCHEFFRHSQFPLERMRDLGINVCLGTDSLASNNGLDLRSEIRQAQVFHRELAPVDWWRMVTLNGARALGLTGTLGEISPGALADLVAFPLRPHDDPFASLIASKTPPSFLMVNGERKEKYRLSAEESRAWT